MDLIWQVRRDRSGIEETHERHRRGHGESYAMVHKLRYRSRGSFDRELGRVDGHWAFRIRGWGKRPRGMLLTRAKYVRGWRV